MANITTTSETLLSMSRLNISEGCQEQIVPSRIRKGKPQSTTQLKTLNNEMGACSSWSAASTVQDIAMSDEVVTETIGLGKASDNGKDEQMVLDDHGNQLCTRSRTDIAETLVPHKTDDIHVNYNYGTVIVDLGEGDVKEPATGVGTKAKTSGSCAITTSRKFAHFPGKSSLKFPGFPSSRNVRRNQHKIKRIKRRQRQSSINFPQSKKINAKTVSGRICCTRENDNADINRVVNIHVINNSGNVVIGNDVTYYEGPPELESCYESKEGNGAVVTDGSVVVSPQRGPVICIDKNTMKWLDKFYRITNEIYPLRDNGRWEDFYGKVNKGLWFAKQNGLQEEEILLTIEKSIALGYQKKNDESKQMVKLAEDLIYLSRPGLNGREFLVALLHCQLAALQRRAGKLSKASKSVFIAEQNAEFLPSNLAKAYVIYEKASNWYWQFYYFSEMGQDGVKDDFAKEAKKELKHCISTCEQMLLENDSIYLRRHHFSLVKLALMNLNCSTTSTRNEPINDESIREAGDCISRMQQRYNGQMGESTNMLLHAAQTDYFYRQGDYTNAEVSVRQALHKAESWGFQLQVQEFQERLEEIGLLKQQRAHENRSHISDLEPCLGES